MKGLFILGVQGSGKSTWIKDNASGYVVLNSDAEFLNWFPMDLYDKYWGIGEELVNLRYLDTLRHRRNFAYDRVGMTSEDLTLDRLKKDFDLAKKYGYNLRLVFIKTSLHRALKRNALRERKVDEPSLKKTYHALNKSYKEILSWPWDMAEILER